ncbi:MAG: HupE/UreJ family protein [Candidatus Omnitrophica bacterium]|nr:HupE/UreJ family protein [Candidatus Omnitrophota bacterium]MCB9722257.1 HupE/UreJ family protein [Candidatus Omnitrophota bacterium]
MAKRIRKLLIGLSISVAVVALLPAWARAHSPGNSLLELDRSGDRVTGTLTIYYGDLPLIVDGLPFQVPDTSGGSWSGYETLILSFLNEHLNFFAGESPLRSRTRFGPITQIDSQANMIIPIVIHPLPERITTLSVEQTGFYRTNPQYSTLFKFKDGRQVRSMVLSRNHSRTKVFVDPLVEARSFLTHGFAHILAGIDHILFIMLLIFSPFLLGKASITDNWRQPAWELVKLATAFTVAHSLTLALAIVKAFVLPSALVEGMIMFSLIFVGIHNLLRLNIRREWLIVFTFGLFHGYGFSGALQNLGLSKGHLLIPLTSFNLGVELGQLLVIALVFPPLYLATRRWQYSVRALRYATAAITLTACWWLIKIVTA